MKILHVTDSFTYQGGVQQYILSVGRLLDENAHSNAVLYTVQSPLTISDGAWPAYHLQLTRDITEQVRAVLTRERPDVAYIHHVSSAALIESLAERIPAAAYVHGFTAVCPGMGKYFRRSDTICHRAFGWGCVPMHYLRRCSAARRPSTLARLMHNTATLKAALRRLPRLLVGSRYMVALLVQNGFPAGKVIVLPPHFLRADTRLTYTPPTDPNCILYAGRLEIEKGVPYLLQALTRLPGARLLVAGDGTQRGRYEADARRLGLADRVTFLGWLDSMQMADAYRQCGVVAMPTICPESFGKAGVEALTYGRPVVAFDVGGISGWLEDGVNGFLVKPKDTQGMATRIGELLHDEGLRTRLGRAGQAGVVVRYSAGQHLATLLAAFRSGQELPMSQGSPLTAESGSQAAPHFPGSYDDHTIPKSR